MKKKFWLTTGTLATAIPVVAVMSCGNLQRPAPAPAPDGAVAQSQASNLYNDQVQIKHGLRSVDWSKENGINFLSTIAEENLKTIYRGVSIHGNWYLEGEEHWSDISKMEWRINGQSFYTTSVCLGGHTSLTMVGLRRVTDNAEYWLISQKQGNTYDRKVPDDSEIYLKQGNYKNDGPYTMLKSGFGSVPTVTATESKQVSQLESSVVVTKSIGFDFSWESNKIHYKFHSGSMIQEGYLSGYTRGTRKVTTFQTSLFGSVADIRIDAQSYGIGNWFIFGVDVVVNGVDYITDDQHYDWRSDLKSWSVNIPVESGSMAYQGINAPIPNDYDNWRSIINEIYNAYKTNSTWTSETGWHDVSNLPDIIFTFNGVKYRINKTTSYGFYICPQEVGLVGMYLEREPFGTANGSVGIVKPGGATAGWTFVNAAPGKLVLRDDVHSEASAGDPGNKIVQSGTYPKPTLVKIDDTLVESTKPKLPLSDYYDSREYSVIDTMSSRETSKTWFGSTVHRIQLASRNEKPITQLGMVDNWNTELYHTNIAQFGAATVLKTARLINGGSTNKDAVYILPIFAGTTSENWKEVEYPSIQGLKATFVVRFNGQKWEYAYAGDLTDTTNRNSIVINPDSKFREVGTTDFSTPLAKTSIDNVTPYLKQAGDDLQLQMSHTGPIDVNKKFVDVHANIRVAVRAGREKVVEDVIDKRPSNLVKSLTYQNANVMEHDGIRRIGVTWYKGSPDLEPIDGRWAGCNDCVGGLLTDLKHFPATDNRWTGLTSNQDYISQISKNEVAAVDVMTYREVGVGSYLKANYDSPGGFYYYRVYIRFNPENQAERQYQLVPIILNNNGADEIGGSYNMDPNLSLRFNEDGWKTWPTPELGDGEDWARIVEVRTTETGRGWMANFRFTSDGRFEIGGQRDGANPDETMTVLAPQVWIYSNPTQYKGQTTSEFNTEAISNNLISLKSKTPTIK